MKKEDKVQNDKRKRLIILITVIALIVVILGSIIIRNTVVNQEANEESKLAGANQNSGLIANNIKKGITIGGITGTLVDLDTSDANATPEDILAGKTAYVNGVKITGTYIPKPSNIEEAKNTGYEFKENTIISDTSNPANLVKIPAGFKIAEDSGTKVEEGIVIEDVSAGNNDTKGSQFVWIPIGKIQTTEGEKDIVFGRYTFDSDGNETLVQTAEDYASETQLSDNRNAYQELLKTTTSSNTKAKDIEAFVTTAITSGGYYIGRYEAGDATATNEGRTDSSPDDNPIVCKAGVYPYNWITQSQASNLCQNMYSNNNFTSDLINSYAWDTAIVFIQECSGDTDYSRQIGQNTANALQKVGESILSFVDSGDEAKDIRCNIYDMAGNLQEWTTETFYGPAKPTPPTPPTRPTDPEGPSGPSTGNSAGSFILSIEAYSDTGDPCVDRGGNYASSYDYTSSRFFNITSYSDIYIASRTTLYL